MTAVLTTQSAEAGYRQKVPIILLATELKAIYERETGKGSLADPVLVLLVGCPNRSALGVRGKEPRALVPEMLLHRATF